MNEWGQPQNFVWLWAVPGAALAFALAGLRRRGRMRAFGETALVAKLFTNLSPGRRLLKRIFLLASIALVVFALAQPHFAKRETLVERRGTDVFIAIDVSNSMLAKDVAPSRLEKAKLELAGVVDRLKGDRIGIVAFAGEAFIQCPLTLDRGAVKLFLSTVSPNLVSVQGTSLSRAIDTAAEAFQREGEGKALILLTDGEDHEGEAVAAAERAQKKGVRIFAIGIGTPEGRTVPDEIGSGFKRDRAGRPVVSKLNEALLKEIAGKTKGKYYRSSRGDLEADDLAREIKKLTKSGTGQDVSVEYEEHYRWFLFPAFLLLFAEAFLSERKPERRERAPKKRREKAGAAALALAFAWPFLCGFSFVSEHQNERGNRYYRKGQVGRAKNAYLAAQKADPKAPEIAFNLGNAYYKEESLKESTEAYQKAAAAAAGPLRSKAFYNLGNSLARENRVDAAIEAFKEALRNDPRDADAKYNLEVLIRRKEEEKKNPEEQKKEDQKKDQKDQQDQQNRKNQDNQKKEGGQGQQDQQEQNQPQNQENPNQQNSGKDKQSGQQDQGQQEKEDQKEQGQGSEDNQSPQESRGGGQKEEEQPGGQGQEQKENAPKPEGSEGKGGQEKEQQAAGGEGSEEREKPQEPGEGQGGGRGDREREGERPEGPKPGGEGGSEGREAAAEEEREGSEAQPKSAAQVQAEQLLEALEGQERQVLKMNSGNERRRIARRVNERDW